MHTFYTLDVQCTWCRSARVVLYDLHRSITHGLESFLLAHVGHGFWHITCTTCANSPSLCGNIAENNIFCITSCSSTKRCVRTKFLCRKMRIAVHLWLHQYTFAAAYCAFNDKCKLLHTNTVAAALYMTIGNRNGGPSIWSEKTKFVVSAS